MTSNAVKARHLVGATQLNRGLTKKTAHPEEIATSAKFIKKGASRMLLAIRILNSIETAVTNRGISW
ncbi:MAG TPA: hypothetical protein VJZ03_02485 [Candidatus Bathyarchaeia archaeon]|nr:hypothetical protein [Candidatus Bathyarchaeia archaeon]